MDLILMAGGVAAGVVAAAVLARRGRAVSETEDGVDEVVPYEKPELSQPVRKPKAGAVRSTSSGSADVVSTAVFASVREDSGHSDGGSSDGGGGGD